LNKLNRLVKYIATFFSLITLLFYIFSPASNCFAQGEKKYSNEIAPYVEFLKTQKTKPVDYILGLFEKYEVVILCERYHTETTQYEMIYDIVSDPRFIDKAGHIFTEIGSSSVAEKTHNFLFSKNLDDAAIKAGALDIYRNLTWFPVWEKTNFFNFLQKLYRLNATLPDDKKIELHPCDMPLDWSAMTPEKYEKFDKTLRDRDKIMADKVIEIVGNLNKSGAARKKALVIMNYRHAFSDRFKILLTKKQDNTGRYIFEAFPGKTANVMINSFALLPGTTDQKTNDTPVQSGKWDAAFEADGNRDLGFDFEGSPFGKDYFDYFAFFPHFCSYSTVFNGFIFYKPLSEHKQMTGVPGLMDDGYDKIIADRFVICGSTTTEASLYVDEFKKAGVREFSYEKMAEHEKAIKKWLK